MSLVSENGRQPDFEQLLGATRPAVRALFTRVRALLPGVLLQPLSIDRHYVEALASPLPHEFAVIEWNESSQRWSICLRLVCELGSGTRSLAIVPRDDHDAARAARDGGADAVVWHDDSAALDRALARLLCPEPIGATEP